MQTVYGNMLENVLGLSQQNNFSLRLFIFTIIEGIGKQLTIGRGGGMANTTQRYLDWQNCSQIQTGAQDWDLVIHTGQQIQKLPHTLVSHCIQTRIGKEHNPETESWKPLTVNRLSPKMPYKVHGWSEGWQLITRGITWQLLDGKDVASVMEKNVGKVITEILGGRVNVAKLITEIFGR